MPELLAVDDVQGAIREDFMRSLVVFGLVLAIVVAAPSYARDEQTPYAKHLQERPSALRLVEVQRAESDPIQFALVVEIEMPEPGWTLEVQSVAAPDATGRILVKMAGKRPEGMLPQAMTWTQGRVSLGSLRAGHYLVDVLLETPMAPHGRVGVLSLHASD